GPVAPVQAFHGLGALAHRGADAIHRRVAAADHHDPLARGVERAGIERRHRLAQALAVARGEILEGRHDVGETGARQADVARAVDTGADEQSVVPRAQLLEAHVAANLAAQAELDAAIDQHLAAPLDHALFQLEVGNAVDQETADPVVAVVHADLVALLAQLLGDREAGRPRADHADRLGTLARGLGRLDPAHLERGVGDVLLDRADGHGLEALLDHAVALAQPVLGADAAAHLGHVVGRRGQLVRLLDPILGGHAQPVGDVVVQRAMHLAERNAALLAARRLLRRPLGVELRVDLREITASLDHRPLVGHGLRYRDELHHFGGHAGSPPDRTVVAAPRSRREQPR